MPTKQITWPDGSTAVLTYSGQGSGPIVVQSDPNNHYEARSAQITVRTTDGSDIERTVTIVQSAKIRIDISTAVVTAPTQTYSGSALTPTPTVTLNGEAVPSSGYDVVYSDNTNAGTATITVTGKGDYTGTATGTFIINKANPTYTAPTARTGLTYSGNLQYLTTAGSTNHGTIQYSDDGSSWSTTRIRKTNAGSYTTYWRLVGDNNHNDVASTSLSTTIAKASGSISYATSSVSKTHTGGVTFTNDLTKSGDGTVTYASSNTSVATVNSSGLVTVVGVGSATITATVADGTNYTYSTKTASYSLTAKSYAQDLGYVTSGLVFALDGEYKGNDNSNWVDLAGGKKFPWANCTRGTNKVTFNGSGLMKTASSTRFYQASYTIEVCFTNNSTGNTMIMFPATQGDVMMSLNYPDDVYYWGSSSANYFLYHRTDHIISANNARRMTNGRAQTSALGTDYYSAQIDGYLKIGGRGTDRFFNGDIYSIRIYNRQLSESEMIQNQTVDNTRFGFGLTMAQDYISDGLVFKLDGINKGSNSGYWTDLVGGIKFPIQNCTVNSNNIEFNKTGIMQVASSASFPYSNCTIEVAYDAQPSGSWAIILFPSSASNIMLALLDNGSGVMGIDHTTVAGYYDISYISKLVSINDDYCIVASRYASHQSAGTWGGTNGNLKIGGRSDYLYKGKIYSIRIYNRKLSPQEITQNQMLDNIRFSLNEKI